MTATLDDVTKKKDKSEPSAEPGRNAILAGPARSPWRKVTIHSPRWQHEYSQGLICHRQAPPLPLHTATGPRQAWDNGEN